MNLIGSLSEGAAIKTPKEKYSNEPHYNYLVTMLATFICEEQYTAAEVKAAAEIASVIAQETNNLKTFSPARGRQAKQPNP